MSGENRKRRLGQWHPFSNGGGGSDGNFGMHSFQHIYWNSETVTFLSFSTISARRAGVNFWLNMETARLRHRCFCETFLSFSVIKPAAAHLRLPPYEYRLTLQNFKKILNYLLIHNFFNSSPLK